MDKIEYLNKVIRNNFEYKGPKKLYKYRQFDEYTFDMLENNYVFLCQVAKLNDDTECNVNLDIDKYFNSANMTCYPTILDLMLEIISPSSSFESIQKIKDILFSVICSQGGIKLNWALDAAPEIENNLSNEESVLLINVLAQIKSIQKSEKVQLQLRDEISMILNAKNNAGVCSFSESNKVDEMWNGKYIKNKNGYCIEYDVSDYEYNFAILPVIYEDNRNSNLIESLLRDKICSALNYLKNNDDDMPINYLKLYLAKNKTTWSYEKEWRLLGDANEHIRAPKITCITIGKNCKESDKEAMVAFCNSHKIRVDYI